MGVTWIDLICTSNFCKYLLQSILLLIISAFFGGLLSFNGFVGLFYYEDNNLTSFFISYIVIITCAILAYEITILIKIHEDCDVFAPDQVTITDKNKLLLLCTCHFITLIGCVYKFAGCIVNMYYSTIVYKRINTKFIDDVVDHQRRTFFGLSIVDLLIGIIIGFCSIYQTALLIMSHKLYIEIAKEDVRQYNEKKAYEQKMKELNKQNTNTPLPI